MKTPTAFRPIAQGCPRLAGYPGNARLFCALPQRGCVGSAPGICHNPVGVGELLIPDSQGSRFAPTLGWLPLPRWGKPLYLTPKLRAAKSDAERQTLQNAVTATDQQIDALVYELYGLAKEEIKLVEGETQ